MRPDRGRTVGASPEVSPDFLSEFAALRAEVCDLRRRVAVLEAVRRPRDAADVELVQQIARSVGGRRFTCRDLIAHAAVDPALAAALEAADVRSARELGKVFARIAGTPIGDLCLDCVAKTRAGLVYAVRVLRLSQSHADPRP